nr:MAG TPA: hypothetical protein [Caudoviricetes sp.]
MHCLSERKGCFWWLNHKLCFLSQALRFLRCFALKT